MVRECGRYWPRHTCDWSFDTRPPRYLPGTGCSGSRRDGSPVTTSASPNGDRSGTRRHALRASGDRSACGDSSTLHPVSLTVVVAGSAYGTAVDPSVGRTAALRVTAIRGAVTQLDDARIAATCGHAVPPGSRLKTMLKLG
jgi:hypothetical protein